MAYMNYGNPYLSGSNQYMSPYTNNVGYQNQYAMQTQPQYQQPVQYTAPQQQNVYEIPIQAVKFVTEDEAKAYIVMPNQRVLLIDRINGKAYDKSADSSGQSKSKTYDFVDPDAMEAKQTEPKVVPAIDMEEYAKKDELGEFVKQDTFSQFRKEISAKFDDFKKSVIEKYLSTDTVSENARRQEARNGNKQ